MLSSRFLYHLLSNYVSSESGKSKSDEISPGELLFNYVMELYTIDHVISFQDVKVQFQKQDS